MQEGGILPKLSDYLGCTVSPDPEILGLTADSRQVQPGFAFVALAGTKADGASFIADALNRGAVAVVAQKGASVPPSAVPLVRVDNVRQTLARMAARLYPRQPEIMAAVTGTNGKTSTALFARQMWQILGHKSAALGTLGVIADGWPVQSSLTTPDPVTLHQTLSRLAAENVTHACMEASSHGLEQHRLDGVQLYAGAFTNLTRDHLDYHRTMEAYGAAKLRLFADLLPSGAGAVVNMDSPFAAQVLAVAKQRGLTPWRFGRLGVEIRLVEVMPQAEGHRLTLEVLGRLCSLYLPLAGGFQVANALTALGLVLACGERDVTAAVAALERLQGVHGRLQRVAARGNGAPVYVDYAHTPDALETVLTALRPHAPGRLVVVFGCGGDRDMGKRRPMAEIAVRLADRVIVTDDNPRSEDPAMIRATLMASAPAAVEIADRAQAIAYGVGMLDSGDLLVIAGKGHEQGQIVGDRVLPFDDCAQACAAVRAVDGGDGAV